MQTHTSRHFVWLLLGQIIALLGSSLSGFTLGIWAYEQIGSSSIYTIIALVNIVPIFALSPIAGVVADKFNRKTIMVLANIASLAVVFFIWRLYLLDQLTVLWLISLVALNATFTAFVVPVVSASIPMMVSKHHLNRANGVIALCLALIQFLTPIVSGSLYQQFGLELILMADLFSGIIALLILLCCFIPQPHAKELTEKSFNMVLFFKALSATWHYLQSIPGIMSLIIFYGFMVSFSTGIAILVQPMLLSLTDPATMGSVLSLASAGLIVGSLIVIVIKQPRNHSTVICCVSIAFGLGCFIVPIFQSAVFIAIGGFFVMICHPIFDANNRALLQRKIDPEQLGRVIGLRNFFLGLMQVSLFIGMGPLADFVFEPMMEHGKLLHHYFSPLWGAGEGRGIALMISLMGAIILISGCYQFLSKKIKQVDGIEDKIAEEMQTVES